MAGNEQRMLFESHQQPVRTHISSNCSDLFCIQLHQFFSVFLGFQVCVSFNREQRQNETFQILYILEGHHFQSCMGLLFYNLQKENMCICFKWHCKQWLFKLSFCRCSLWNDTSRFNIAEILTGVCVDPTALTEFHLHSQLGFSIKLNTPEGRDEVTLLWNHLYSRGMGTALFCQKWNIISFISFNTVLYLLQHDYLPNIAHCKL